MSPQTLAQVLQPLKSIFNEKEFPELLVGLSVSDDAAVYKINSELALVHTLDFFTPVVDDPYTFGAIAAANSMSDIYAMGGEVILALNIAGFPCTLSPEVITEIFRGGSQKVAEAGGVIAGGHTINAKEPMYGLSVIGKVHPDRIFTKSNAAKGDILFLTKPLGVGVIATAAKRNKAFVEQVNASVDSMLKLNKNAADLLRSCGSIRACTDVTGFSLLGHSSEIAEKSGVKIVIWLNRVPFLDGAESYAYQGNFPLGTKNNTDSYNDTVFFSDTIPSEIRSLLFSPETSGGLLFCVRPDKQHEVESLFKNAGQAYWIIGEVEEGKGVSVVL